MEDRTLTWSEDGEARRFQELRRMGWNIPGPKSDGCCVKSARGGANFLPVWPGANQRKGSRDYANFITSSHATFRDFRTWDFLHHVMFLTALNLFS